MDFEKLKEGLARIPLVPVLLVWAIYLGWQYYGFVSDETSPLVQKQGEIEAAKAKNIDLTNHLNEVQQFKKNLDVKRMEIRDLTRELDSFKATISEDLNVPEFMQSTLTEARKVGLTIASLKPSGSDTHEYYAEQSFDLKFRGAFVQLVVFLERLSNMQKIVRVEDLRLKPIGSPLAKFVELEGIIEIKTFRYRGSRADELAKKQNSGEGQPQTVPTAGGSP